MFERTPEMYNLIRRLRSVTPKVGRAKKHMRIEETRPVNPDGDEAARMIDLLEKKVHEQGCELFDLREGYTHKERELELLRLVERLVRECEDMRKELAGG